MKSQLLDIPVPLQGLDLSGPYERQPPATTPAARNVRGFDAASGRRRLSRRQGTVRFINAPVNGIYPVQELNALVGTQFVAGSGLVIPGSGAATLSGTAVVGATNDTSAAFYVYAGGNRLASLGSGAGSSREQFAGAATDGTNFYVTTVTLTSRAVNLYKVSPTGQILWWQTPFTTVSQDADTRDRTQVGLANQGTPGLGVGAPACGTAGGNVFVAVEGQGVFRFAQSSGAPPSANPWITDATLKAGLGGYQNTGAASFVAGTTTLAVGLNKLVAGQNADVGVYLYNTATNQPRAALGLQKLTGTGQQTGYPYLFNDGNNFYVAIPNYANTSFRGLAQVAPTGAVNWSVGVGDAVAFGYYSGTGQVVISGNTANSFLSTATGQAAGAGLGTGLVGFSDAGSGLIFLESATQLFLSNGSANLWNVAGLATSGYPCGLPVGAASASGALADQGSPANLTNYNRSVVLVGVAGGTVKVAYSGTWATPANGRGALNAAVSVIRSAPNNGSLYFADGKNWKSYDPTKNSVQNWTASSGTLPADSAGNTPRLIATWRGRTVLSGLPLDPANWFMSAVNDPSNWNYAPKVSVETQAVAGNNSPAGLIGDVTTALIPYSDDVMIFGGDHTIWQMTGDPMAGGRVDLVSDVTGIAWGNAWCKDCAGTCYFMGSKGGVYALVPGAVPQRLSQPIDQALASLNMAQVVVRLAYQERWQGLHVFITPLAGGATTHFYWDSQTTSWWQDSFANAPHNPYAVLAFDGDDPTQRQILLGGQDGYVRIFSPSAADDDGTPISSSVLCGPLLVPGGMAFHTQDLQGTLAGTEGAVNWGVQAGNSAEQAALAAPLFSGSFVAGRNFSQPARAAGTALYVSLSSSAAGAPWSLEALRASAVVQGRARQRIIA